MRQCSCEQKKQLFLSACDESLATKNPVTFPCFPQERNCATSQLWQNGSEIHIFTSQTPQAVSWQAIGVVRPLPGLSLGLKGVNVLTNVADNNGSFLPFDTETQTLATQTYLCEDACAFKRHFPQLTDEVARCCKISLLNYACERLL